LIDQKRTFARVGGPKLDFLLHHSCHRFLQAKSWAHGPYNQERRPVYPVTRHTESLMGRDSHVASTYCKPGAAVRSRLLPICLAHERHARCLSLLIDAPANEAKPTGRLARGRVLERPDACIRPACCVSPAHLAWPVLFKKKKVSASRATCICTSRISIALQTRSCMLVHLCMQLAVSCLLMPISCLLC
jgi:hypothetical protein